MKKIIAPLCLALALGMGLTLSATPSTAGDVGNQYYKPATSSTPDWAPFLVYSNGKQTNIWFPIDQTSLRGMELPLVFGVDGNKLISATQTFSDNHIVVDGVFEEFELMLGEETLRLTAVPDPIKHGSHQDAVLHAKSIERALNLSAARPSL